MRGTKCLFLLVEFECVILKKNELKGIFKYISQGIVKISPLWHLSFGKGFVLAFYCSSWTLTDPRIAFWEMNKRQSPLQSSATNPVHTGLFQTGQPSPNQEFLLSVTLPSIFFSSDRDVTVANNGSSYKMHIFQHKWNRKERSRHWRKKETGGMASMMYQEKSVWFIIK